MAFTGFAVLARIRPAFSNRVFSRDKRRERTYPSRTSEPHPANPRTVTDDPGRRRPLTARSADVQTLLNRQVSIFSLCAAVAALLIPAVAARAQQTTNPAGANAAKFGIAVVDIPYIFKNYSRFRATSEGMKKEMETIDANVKAERASITQAEQKRNSLNVGTPDYKLADEELARMMAEFQLKTSKLQKDFMERQAKLYYQTYLEVVAAVNTYAKSQNIGLVLRFNGEDVDPNNRQQVMNDINKHVVIQNQIDITPDVLLLLNRDGQQVQPRPAGVGGVVPRTGAQPGSQLPPR
jgi:Skp family chaperone for outer membrane proteins